MSVNVVMLKGRIGKINEVRYTPSGTAVLTFTLATSEKWKDKNGEAKEKTTWHRVEAWQKQAEILAEHAVVGQELFIQGQLDAKEYDDKEGKKVTAVVVRVREFDFGPKPKARAEEGAAAPQQRPSAAKEHGGAQSSTVTDGDEGDIPF